MTDYVIAPPAERVIPVTKNCDRAFSVQRVDADNNPLNFAEGTSVYLWADTKSGIPVKVDATISGSLASFVLQSAVCDQVKTGGRWQAVLDLGDMELPLLVGKFERHDG